MGIVVKINDKIIFYVKGADVVMRDIVNNKIFIDEECENLAREGLRTLVMC